MIYTKEDIEQLDRITRLKIISSVTGIKSANLIGTINDKGDTNLAVFSSCVHLGSNPPLLGFISRPRTKEVGHTYRNIQENEYYTINYIHPEFVKTAHYTSAKFPEEISEFDRCNLSEEYINGFKEAIDIKINDTVLVIGQIEHLILPDTAIVDDDIDLEAINGVGISGLNSCYSLKKIDRNPYVGVNEVPGF